MHDILSAELRALDQTRLTLLIVDESEAARRLLSEVLRGAGFVRLYMAKNITEAFDMMCLYHIDLLLTGWELQGQTGLDLAVSIRMQALNEGTNLSNPRLPMILVTTKDRKSHVLAARNAGIDEYVLKPFSQKSLLKVVLSCFTKPRDFVISPAFIGPCRRRKAAKPHQGLLRRIDDIKDAALRLDQQKAEDNVYLELMGLKTLMDAKGGLSPEALDHLIRRLDQTEGQISSVRHRWVEKAAQSLKHYTESLGIEVDNDIITIHLDALIRLNTPTCPAPDEAETILRDLDKLMKTRLKGARPVRQSVGKESRSA